MGPIKHRESVVVGLLLAITIATIHAALSLALFAWLLTLHPTAAGRVYAAYGAVYVSVALVWLRVVDGVPLTLRDLVGVVVVFVGMGVLMGGAQRG